MNLREFVAKLGLQVNPTGFKAADELFGKLRKTMLQVQTIGGAVGLAFEVAQGAAQRLGAAFAEMGDQATHLQRTAALAGTTSAELQGLEGALSRVGISGESLKGTLTGLMAKMYDTTTGSVGAVMAFSRLGVSIRQVGGGFKPVTEVLDQALEKLAKIKDPIMRFGKAAAVGLSEYLPAIENGIEGFRKLQNKVRDFSAELSGDDIAAVKAYKAAMADVGLFMQGLRNNTLGPFYDLFAKVGERVSKFIQADKGNTLRDLRQSFGQFGSLADPIAKIIEFGFKLLPMLGMLTRFLAGVGRVIGVVTDGIIGFLEWMYKVPEVGNGLTLLGLAVFAAWFPMLALFAAIFLVAEDFIVFFKGGNSAIGMALQGLIKWMAAVEKGGGVMGGLATAILNAFKYISSGRLLTDWNDLIGGIKLAWENFFKWIDEKFSLSSVRKFGNKLFEMGARVERVALGGKNVAYHSPEFYQNLNKDIDRAGGKPVGTTPIERHIASGAGLVSRQPTVYRDGKIAQVNAQFYIDGAKDPKQVASEVFEKYDELAEDTLVSLNQSGNPR